MTSEVHKPIPVADQAVRDHVIRTLDRPLVIEAGAGTGKTTLLVSRLLYALETEAVQMHQIVAISFTEKAAAELRLRLRQELELRCAQTPAGEVGSEPLRRALQDLHRARISTIHAFAASILREKPVEAQLDPQFRTLDELESLQLQRAFWKRWVDDELEGEEAERNLLPALQAGVRLSPDLALLGRSLYDNRDLQPYLPTPEVPQDLDERMQRFRDNLLDCVRHGETNCREADDKGLRHLQELLARSEALGDLQKSSWSAVFLGEFKVQPTKGKKEFWRPGMAAENKEMRKTLQRELQEIQQWLANRILKGSLHWLERWLAAYESEKRRMGVLDFQDLLVHAQQLVRNNLAVRAELGGRIGMLCIDEFQDTDPLQAELVLFLSEEGRPAPEWEDVQVGAKLFLVGDPKQSIYRFRRADLDVYKRCCQRVVQSGGEVLDIVQNFRSRPAILHWTNGVFETLFAKQEETTSDPRHVPLVPLPEPGLRRPAVWVLRNSPQASANGATPQPVRQQEAEAIVRMIHRARQEKWLVRGRTALRPVRAGDMAILFGRTSGIELYEDALRQAGIPFRQEGGKLFFQRQEVRDVLHALAACDDPHDEWSIVAALRSPLFGVSDEELWMHRARFRSLRYTEAFAGSALEGALGLLHDLHKQRHRLGTAGCIEELLLRTAARAVYAVQPQGDRALMNFEMLVRQARAFESTGDLGLREFVRSLRELEEETPRLAEWSPDEEEGDHVRLLTVHMAKGLEFPFVVLANLNASGNTRSEPLLFDRLQKRAEARLGVADLRISLKTSGFAEVAEQEKKREQAEERRLLYVAATRARDYLLVGNFTGSKPSGYLKFLQTVDGALGTAAFGALPPPHQAHREEVLQAEWCVVEARDLLAVPPTPVLAQPRDAHTTWIPGRAAWQDQHQRRLQLGRAPGGRITPVDLLVQGVSGAALEEAQQDSSRLGVVTHAVLEEWQVGINEESLHRMVLELCDRHHSSDLFEQVLGLVRRVEIPPFLERIESATSIRRATRMVQRVGDRLLEALQDVVIENGDGVTAIDFTVRSTASANLLSEQRAQVLRGALLCAAGKNIVCVGTIFLGDGVWIELDQAQQKSSDYLVQCRAEQVLQRERLAGN